MIVIDASVIVSALVERGPVGAWSEAQLEHENLVAPHILAAEVHSAIRRIEHHGGIDSTTAGLAILELGSLTIRLFPFSPLSDRIWQLKATLTPYDAWYVALAEAFGCELVTLDGRLARSNGAECSIVTPPENIARG